MARKVERRYTSARKRAEQQKTGFESTYLKIPEGMQMFKPKAGTMLLDIIPFVAGKGNPWAEEGSIHWERTIWTHRGIGANSDTYICPRMTSKKRCPICEARAKLMKTAEDEEDEQMVKDLAPKQRQLFLLKNLKEPDKGIQLWDISYHLFGKVLDARLRNSDEDDNWDKFFFLEDGYTLRVGFAEESFGGHAFFKAETIDFKPRKTPYEEDILDEVPSLDGMVSELEYDKLKKILLQVEADKEEEDDDEEEDEPKGKSSAKSSKSSRRSSDDEEDDEDDEDEDDEEDDDEEAKSSTKSPSRSRHSSDVDDEEEDDDEEDDEEPKGKSKSGKSSRDSSEKKQSKDDDDDDEDWDDFDDEDEEEKKSSKKSSSKTSSKSKDDDEEEDDDEEDDETPKKKGRFSDKGKMKAEEEEEDDDDWEDDDDEEETPKKKKK